MSKSKRPGYHSKPRADGTVSHYWNPRRAFKKAPPILSIVRLPDDITDEQIDSLCTDYTQTMLVELDNDNQPAKYDGRLSSLILLYRTDPYSPYARLKSSTRKGDYEPALRLIDTTVGQRAIHNLKGDDFIRWHAEWLKIGNRTAHSAIRKLRAVMSYGTSQRLVGCKEAREILSLLRFEMPPSRKSKLEKHHAWAICEKAIEHGRPSIALTQAIQWDTALRRIHIIGEWLSVDDAFLSTIIRGRTKWRGLSAADVDENMILTVPHTSKGKAATRHDLSVCELVSWVLERTSLPESGPLIVSETTGIPYRTNYYSHDWRKIADLAGVPRDVFSMDTRAGAISEAEELSGLEPARKMAGHTNSKTTLGYVRNDDLNNNRAVAKARSKRDT